MPVNIRGTQYLKVVERLDVFRVEHSIDSGWSITTEVIHRDAEVCAVKAYISNPDGHVIATGTAEERRDQGPVNQTSAMENAETSAVGRALSFAGYPGSEIASADEVGRAINQQSAPVDVSALVEDWRSVAIHFGKNKDKRLGDLSPNQISWYETIWTPYEDKDGNNRTPSQQDLQLRAALDASMEEEERATQAAQNEIDAAF